MAKSTRTSASYVAEARNTKEKKKNPFAGMTMAEMKAKYSKMTPAQRAANVQTFRDAAKSTPKSKPATKKTTKSEAASRFYSSSSGTRGQNLPSNPQLKSSPKRSNFPAGRAGQAKYRAALRNHNKKPAKPRRAALTMAERRRARRSTR